MNLDGFFRNAEVGGDLLVQQPALKEPELSPRELTVSFIDQQRYSKLTVEKRLESKPIKVQVN
jgi:hypothetical protein